MLKQKNTVKFINDKNISIYSINIPSEWISYKDIKRADYIKNHLNITANKAESSMASFFGWLSEDACDNKCNYETFLYYPTFSALASYNSLTGVKRPKNKEYPSLLDMEAIGYGSLLLSNKVLSNKNNIPFPKVFKTFLIQQSGSFIAKQLTKDDKYYLDTNKLAILNQDDNTSLNLSDENIFRPSQHWNVITGNHYYPDLPLYRQNILREWNRYKYYGSKIKTNKFVFNQSKYDEYIKSLVNDKQEFISFEAININTTPKEDIIRYICQEALTEYYDFNDEFTFVIDNNTYTFDFDLEEFRDANFNIIQFIKTFPNIIITMNEYKSIIKDLVTIEQTYFIREIINKLKANDFDFTGFGYDQQKPYTFSENEIISFENNEVLVYHKDYGLTALYKADDFSETPSHKNMADLYSALSNDLPLIEYDNKITFNGLLDTEQKTMYSAEQLCLMLFNLVTQTNEIQIEGNLDKYYIYLYERYKTNKDNEIDKCEILPILLVDGVTCYNKALVRKETSRYVRTYIPENERLNYARVFKDNNGMYIYANQSTKLETPEKVEFEILNDDGSITTEEREVQYSSEPETSKIMQEYIKDKVKFSLPPINISLDMRVKKLIEKFKNNQITGYFLKYKDLNDNKIKIKLINDEDYLSKICDKEDIFLDLLPIVPFYSLQDVVIPLKTRTQIWKLRLGALAGSKSYRYFYYIYNKKVNQYYKRAYKLPLLEWDTQINGQYEDKEYDVKTKKLSKIYTNEKSMFYSESFLQHPYSNSDKASSVSKISSDYNTYFQSNHGIYGCHSSIRFTFAIFFNKFVRKTKLLNKMAIEYLEFYFSNFNGIYDIEFNMYVYPNDRIQYIEKRLLLSFTKRKLTKDEITNLKAKYYSEFNYNQGKIIFYNKLKKEKYELNVNKLYPRWKQSFFNDRIFTKSANKYDYLTIKKDDLVPLKHTDILNVKYNSDLSPINIYKYSNGAYRLDLESYYYNLPIDIRYKTNKGTISRKVNFWKNALEYKTFYTPYDASMYNQSYNIEQLDNFQERNIYDSLTNIFNKKTLKELEIIYKDIFNKDITLPLDNDNIFDCEGLFSNGMLSEEEPIDFENETRTEVIQTKTSVKLQDYEFKENKYIGTSTRFFDPSKIWNDDEYKITQFENIVNMFKPLDLPGNLDLVGWEKRYTRIYDFAKEYQDILQRTNYQNIELCQSKRLYDTYTANNLINPIFDRKQCIEEIVEYLLQNELPLYKTITPKIFKEYFIDYSKDSKLANIFTDREIYELGFQNYLISSELETLDDITITLPQIQKIISNLITKMDLENGNIKLDNYWLPLPVNAYKKFPYYSKKFCTTYFSLIEGYMCYPIPVVDSGINKDNRAYGVAMSILGLIIAIVSFTLAAITGGGSVMASMSLISSMIGIFASMLNIIAMFLPAEHAQMIKKLATIFSYASSVFSLASGVNSFSNLTGLQITNMVVTSVNFAISISIQAIELIYQTKIDKEKQRLNSVIEEYNKSVDEANEFLKENEFNELLAIPNQINADALLARKTNVSYDDLYEGFTQVTLDLLYEDIDTFYDRRLD